MTLTRTLLSVITLTSLPPLIAEAHEPHLFMDVAAVSALHDRGEQIGREVLEFGVGIEVDVKEATVYGAFYRLLPVGDEQEAFDDEADFTLGVAWAGTGYSADVSANWLTFPGEEAESSLELAGAVTLDAPYAPTLVGFYDADLEDWGLEIAAGPEWEAGLWTVYALGRAGFVHPGDGSAHRSYGGVEIGASRPAAEFAEFGFFARADVSDEDAFARRINGGEVTAFRSSGISAGISLSLSH
ncbi:hypothetical protein HNE_2327 [Hyphomonas neptunium ATCC 15444]|uniref:Uncharacterized protein n=2 Tax=Hyphomonas TaxID=85 RepID=Q0BZS1_HYPNA|nr:MULTISPECIES: hypothetical protein [Hyphomonas]ABI77168.1 hypothetical protein HNE_2327 [Hyphomonas neptunium ATCC 15444]